jgi:hypothetical protein
MEAANFLVVNDLSDCILSHCENNLCDYCGENSYLVIAAAVTFTQIGIEATARYCAFC